MKIFSWNCYRGEVETKVEELTLFSPDIVCLQECKGETTANGNVVSSRRNKHQGIAIWARDGDLIVNSVVIPDFAQFRNSDQRPLVVKIVF